jgi:hypothetical protein
MSQTLDLEIRSAGPAPDPIDPLWWSGYLTPSTLSGVPGVANALKRRLGLRYCGGLRSRLGARS